MIYLKSGGNLSVASHRSTERSVAAHAQQRAEASLRTGVDQGPAGPVPSLTRYSPLYSLGAHPVRIRYASGAHRRTGTASSSCRVYGCAGSSHTRSTGPRSTTLPSRITTTSSHR